MTVQPRARRRGRATVLAVVAATALALVSAILTARYDMRMAEQASNGIVNGLVTGVVAVVGAIVALAVPRNRVGWLMIGSACLLGLGEAVTEAGVYGVLYRGGRDAYLAALGPGLRAAGWIMAVVAVPVFFPDGRLVSLRWRWLAVTLVAAIVAMCASAVLSPGGQEDRLVGWHNPLGLPARFGPAVDWFGLLAILLTLVAAVGAVASVVRRWRHGGAVVRQQVLLLSIASVPPAAVVVLTVVTGGLPAWVFGLAVALVPVAVAVAVLGYGLYDLRRATHRALVWLVMSGSLITVYVTVVAMAASVARRGNSWVVPAAAAVAAALVLVPLRTLAQRGVNRIVYGRWNEPYEVLASLGGQLAAAADIDRLLREAVDGLAVALELTDVEIVPIVAEPDDRTTMPGAEALPLTAYGVPVGWLVYTSDRPLGASERRLLDDVAHGLGVAVHARAMRDDLQRARERLVLAREDERRRLRRDLHDGIGPALAGLTLRAATVGRLLPADAADARARMSDLIEEIRHTVVEVRQLVEGLRPPALDELGLVGACEQAVDRLAAGQLDTRVDADPLPPLPAAVEVAAYRIVVEGVTNTVRHAAARSCRVDLRHTVEGLTVSVTDDGLGLIATGTGGNGMLIMRERAEELGGTFAVDQPRRGVTVRAVLPFTPIPVNAEPTAEVA